MMKGEITHRVFQEWARFGRLLIDLLLGGWITAYPDNILSHKKNAVIVFIHLLKSAETHSANNLKDPSPPFGNTFFFFRYPALNSLLCS